MNPLRSVAAKLSLLTSLCVLGVIALMSRQLSKQTEQALVGEMRVRADFFARSAREAVFPKVDPFAVHMQVKQMLEEKAVTSAMVADADGRVLSHSDPKLIGETLNDELSRNAREAAAPLLQRRRALDGALVYDLAVPLIVGSQKVGTARLGFDESSMRGALEAQRRFLFLAAAAATGAAIAGTVLIVGWITRPLPRLAAAAREVGKGKFDVRVDWRSKDEIGALARSFNDMASANAVLFAAISQEKEKLNTIFQETREGMVWTDPGGRVLLMNPAAKALLGTGDRSPVSWAEARGEFKPKPDDAAILASDGRITPFELQREDPKLLILSGVADRLGTEKDPSGLLFVFHDATLEKRGESLARNFLSIVSHKLRTPLAVALGYLELLESDESVGADQKKAIKKIREQDEQLRTLVEKLIVFTLAQSQESIVLEKAPVKLEDVMDGALKAQRDLLSEKKVKVTKRADAGIPELSADGGLLREALSNLVENAVKFNTKDRKELSISLTRDDGSVRISVVDNGPGIPSEEHPKLFRKFYQVDPDFTGQIPGFGLGLSFVKNVAEAHGGSAGLRSVVGEGSEFYVSLPTKAA